MYSRLAGQYERVVDVYDIVTGGWSFFATGLSQARLGLAAAALSTTIVFGGGKYVSMLFHIIFFLLFGLLAHPFCSLEQVQDFPACLTYTTQMGAVVGALDC